MRVPLLACSECSWMPPTCPFIGLSGLAWGGPTTVVFILSCWSGELGSVFDCSLAPPSSANTPHLRQHTARPSSSKALTQMQSCNLTCSLLSRPLFVPQASSALRCRTGRAQRFDTSVVRLFTKSPPYHLFKLLRTYGWLLVCKLMVLVRTA